LEPPKKILIVEDEILNAMSLQMSLRKSGYDICELVTTGEESIQIADKENPDLIVMDISLAGQMDGFEAAEVIRKKHDIPIIFLTGYSDSDILEKANTFEQSTCIKKPANPHRVHQDIEKLLSVK
jgi:CheY-like chemotaxis protein